MTEKELRLEFIEKIDTVEFGTVVDCPRLLEIMQADPRCRRVDLVKVRHGDTFMIMAGGRGVSYRTAIKRYLGLKHTRTRKKWISSAARSTVQSQITAFRRAQGAGADIDIDHAERNFCDLWRDWLALNGLDESSIRIRKSGRVFILADEALRKSWRLYHKENARLEAVQRQEHRERTRRRRTALWGQGERQV